jgi:hypothetical protein
MLRKFLYSKYIDTKNWLSFKNNLIIQHVIKVFLPLSALFQKIKL